MSERPELRPARRRRTAVMLCAYLGVEANEKRVKLITDVIFAGELDFALACHRQGESIRTGVGYHNWWNMIAMSLTDESSKLAYLKEAFSVYSEVSDAILDNIQNGGKPNDVPLAEKDR